jgi:serine/threonine-protein kinase
MQGIRGAATPRLVAGSVIGERYEVGPLLGRGGMAEVYAGTDRRLGRPVAVKLLTPEMAARPDVRTRFEAEARAAASLSHPNVVAVYDTGDHEGVPYIVMERLPGETLADRIAAGPLEVGRVRTMADEVLDALGTAHAAGLVHRDVKPANILLTADGRTKVADFGIAKSAEAARDGDLTGTGQLLGTPAYLAPERMDGAPASPRADLWAVGVVLYETLTGTRAFPGETPLAIARAVESGDHESLREVRPDLDPVLAAAVERAMDPDPARRFSSAGEMAAALGGRTTAGAAGAATTAGAVGAVSGAGAAGAATTAGAVGAVSGATGERPVGGDTVVLGEEPLGRPAGTRRPRWWAGLMALAALLVLLLLLARAGDGGDPPPPGAPGPTAATTLAPPQTAAQTVVAPPTTAAPTVTAAPTGDDRRDDDQGGGEGGGEDDGSGGERRGNGKGGKDKD